MYQMFFQPFQAVDMIKKGSERAFVLMMLVASALSSLAILLLCSNASLTFMKEATKSFQWSMWNYLQYFVMFVVGIYLANAVRAVLIHLVMKIFTEKGTLLDAFKVSTVNCFLMSVYLLLAVIAAAIPVVGVALAGMILVVGILITVSVSLKTLSVLYKTDIITACIGIGIIMVAAVCVMHLSLLAAISANGGFYAAGYKTGGPGNMGVPRMMQQWNVTQGQKQYPTVQFSTTPTPPAAATPAIVAPKITTPAVVAPKPATKK